MTAEDVSEVAALERRCFPDPWSAESFGEEVRHSGDGGYARVIRIEGQLVAYMIAWFVTDEGHLANIAVAPERRQQGLATALLEELTREARLRGARILVLEVRVGNKSAIRLYERFHFKPVAIRKNYYERQREDALVMIRTLGLAGEELGVPY